MLNTQYRMHPDISKFPSKQFYGGGLLNGAVGLLSGSSSTLQYTVAVACGSTQWQYMAVRNTGRDMTDPGGLHCHTGTDLCCCGRASVTCLLTAQARCTTPWHL